MSTHTNAEEIKERNKLSEILPKIGNGEADRRFAEQLEKVVAAVDETGKKGEVTIKVTVAPGKNDAGGIYFWPEVTSKAPSLPLRPGQFHVGEEGEMLTQLEFLMGGGPDEAKPREVEGQQRFAPKVVDVEKPAPRTVKSEAAPRPAPEPATRFGEDVEGDDTEDDDDPFA